VKRPAPLEVDPLARGFIGDPFAAYQRLHAAGAVLWHARLGAWLVPGYAATRELLRDAAALPSIEVGANLRRLGERSRRPFPALAGVFDAVPLLSNAPRHPMLRRYFAAIFAARPISSYVPGMREIAARLLAPARAAGGFDAALDFADRLPPAFMARLLGFAEADLPPLLGLTNGMLVAFNRTLHVREYAALEPRAAEAVAFLAAIAAERRRAPRDDGLSRMLATHFEDRALDDEEVARLALVMFIVGVETTTTLIGSALRLLLEDPARIEELRHNRELVKPAIEEVLRCESPVQNVGRLVASEREIDGQRLAPGERVLLMTGAANRDPAVYPQPDRYDPRRAGPPHVAFGDGPHVCLGATLARTETQVALEAFLELPPLARTATPDTWWPYDWLRRVRSLPVQFT
jgi:cytochrome P450